MGDAMTKNRSLIVPAVVLGVALLVLAALYFVDSASALPSFIPGHEAGSSHHHVKHGIAAAIVGLGLLHLRLVSERPGGYGSICPDTTLNTALLGSPRIAKRPPLGTSLAGMIVLAPSSPAWATVASTSSQAK